MSIITDWETDLVLLSCDSFDTGYYKNLKSFYVNLIKLLQKREKVLCIVSSKNPLGAFVNSVICDDLDLWIRDFAPVVFFKDKLHQFKYKPDYITSEESKIIRDSFAKITKLWNIEKIDLVVDGGNVIHNKKCLIMTEKIYTLNKNKTKDQINNIFYNIGFKKVVTLPIAIGEKIGHADGMVKWINENCLFVNQYPDKVFHKQIMKILSKNFPNADIVEIPYFSSGSYNKNINSAIGCYINFLQTKNAVYVPIFNLPQDDAVQEIFIKKFSKPVEFINCEEIAFHGGVINCITWNCPSFLIPEMG